MFILYEKDNYRYVYDLKNKVRMEGRHGNISCFSFIDSEIFRNLDSDKMSFRYDDDLEYVFLWLKGLSHEEAFKAIMGKYYA